MYPDAALYTVAESLDHGDVAQALGSYEDLMGWQSIGGFAPDGVAVDEYHEAAQGWENRTGTDFGRVYDSYAETIGAPSTPTTSSDREW